MQILFSILFTGLTISAQLVVQVYDADTYKILHKGKFLKIRLANVDAPALDQYYGNIAKQRVSKLILDKEVKIEAYAKDWHGRTIASVTIDGIRLDSFLLINGWAWHYMQYSYDPGLAIYEDKAKALKRGMWRCKHNVPPWVWRNLSKKQKRLKEMCR